MSTFAAHDDAAALLFVTRGSTEKMAPLFARLRPSLPQIAAAISTPSPVLIYSNYAEYAVTREVDGAQRLFLVTFLRDADGVWRFASM